MILFWLRATIDVRKGALLEVLAVTLPIGILAGRFWMERPGIGLLELGFLVTPGITFIFLCLPSVAGVRFLERLARGEQPRLSDMFRLTTLTALGTFVVNLLRVDFLVVMNVTILTLAYLAGDCIRKLPHTGWRYFLLGWCGLVGWCATLLMQRIDWGPLVGTSITSWRSSRGWCWD